MGLPAEAEELLDYLAAWRVDPVRFVRDVFDVTITEQQLQLLQAVAPAGSRVAVKSGHGTGKTAVLAWLMLWFVLTHEDCKVPCTAPAEPQLKNILWPELTKWYARMPAWLRAQIEITTDQVRVRGAEKSQFAIARTSRKERPEALAGFHATHLMFIIDEASGVPEEIFQTAEGALSTPGARIVMASQPTLTSGYFHQAFHKNRNMWTCLTFNSEKSPLVDAAYIETMADSYGADSDIYRVRVLGEFPRASVVQLIPGDLVERAMGKHLRADQYNFAPVILGVDVAWYGDDRSVVVLRQGLMSTVLGTWREIDNMQLAGLVAQFEDEHQVDATFIDMGWGAGVIDRLRQLGRTPIPVAFGGAATKEQYANKRTEIWCEMKAWLEQGGVLPSNDELRDDLTGPQYGFSAAGKIQLERKEDMKKRGLASPDLGDALALTFTAPVASREREIIPETNGLYFANAKYDLFKKKGG